MPNHHDISSLLPEYHEAIHSLKMRDPHFARLLDQYHQLDKNIVRIEQHIETASDEELGKLKKERLLLEDQIVAMLKKHEAA